MKSGGVQLGFKNSIIALFVAIVLVIGLTLVYLSFQRIAAVTDSAASQFIGKVAESSADRIGSQLKLVRDNLEILNALPQVQSADIDDNPPLIALLAAMLKNNNQLFNLYVGYDDGSFIEMDALEGAGGKPARGWRRPNGRRSGWSSFRGLTRPASNRDGCFYPTSSKPSGSCRVRWTTIHASDPGTRMPLAATAVGSPGRTFSSQPANRVTRFSPR
jgi:hypothetical protein